MKNSSLESFLWIGITFVTFSFLENIPVANDILKMIERVADTSSLSSLRILVGMLFGRADFLGLKFEIISIISSFVQGEMKNESWLGSVKYSKKCYRKMAPLTELTEQKKLLKVFAIARGRVTVCSPRLIIFGESFVVLWREVMDLIPFQVYFMLLILSFKYLPW